jgi:hypothetical protein
MIFKNLYHCFEQILLLTNTGYFTSDNEPDGIENATHNTFAKLTWTFIFHLKNIKHR